MDAKLIMKSQSFEIYRDIWSELASLAGLAGLAGLAENHTQDEPQRALTKLRNFAGLCVSKIYSEFSFPSPPMSKFIELLSRDTIEAIMPMLIINKLHVCVYKN
jgi:type I restriction enzyme R subunit